ncbi:MAG: hypothetical protein J0H41_17065 [Rhizobiales bacterium]|nr:hypothetical protein [Hyphomicrobiales bacterium]
MIDRISRRGPVIERAREPGLPRGLTRLLVLGGVLAGAYGAGLLPEGASLERSWEGATVALNDAWRAWTEETPKEAPKPAQAARPAIAPPMSRPAPPPAVPAPSPPQTPNFNQAIAEARKALSEATSPSPVKPAEAPSAKTADDPFAEAFRRNVLGQLRPGAPSGPAAAPPPSVAPERSSMFSRPPGAPPVPYSAETLDDYVNRHLNAFNASRDVAVKRASIEKVVAAAQLGHGPARGVVVRGFPVSTIIRDVVAPEEAVRFSIDFIVQKRAFSNDARRDFVALAAWFAAERNEDVFGAALFDAVRDDPRLQTPDAANDLMILLHRAERGCAALRRRLNVSDANTTSIDHCGRDLAIATAEKARQSGPAGVEKKRFGEALELVRKTLGSPT